MKKRILSGTLALAMVLSLLAGISIPAFAEPSVLTFLIGGQTILEREYDAEKDPGVLKDILKSGSIKLEGSVLTLTDAVIESSAHNGITIFPITDTATIVLVGDKNKITTSGDNYGISSGGNKTLLTIMSNKENKGSLEITDCGIYSDENNLSIKDCNIVSNNTNNEGIYVYGGDLSISGSNLTATGCDGIYTDRLKTEDEDAAVGGNIAITNSTVTATGDESGIYSYGGNIAITNSTVTATGDKNGIYANYAMDAGGKINITNSEVTSTSINKGIGSENDCSITNSTVTATSTKSNGFGMGIEKGITITNSTVSSTGGYGIISESGGISIQSGKLIAKATYTNGAAIVVGGNIDLATGMFIKDGLYIVSIPYGKSTIQTIAPNKNSASFDGDGNFTGVAKDVEIRGPGTVSVQQPQKPSNISSVTLPSQTDLQNAVLTDADKAAIANGTDVNIQMVVNSVQAPADADKVKQNLGKNTLGLYLDISIFKTVGDSKPEAVHNLNSKIRITFTIPENLRGKDKYYVIRVHDGKTTVLEDLDNDPNTVTFETDQFSTYALVYSAKSAKTSDNSNMIALAVMAATSIAAVAFIEKKKVK